MAQKRIAFFGPVRPVSSGISDYDEELLPLLRDSYEVDVYVDQTVRPANTHPHGDFYFRQRLRPYDLCLYQLGNALIHEYVYGYLFAHPGAVVFHDSCLHHSRAKMMLMKGYYDEYRDEAKAAHPEQQEVADIVLSGMAGDLFLYSFPFVRLVLQSSVAAAAHSDFSVRRLQVTDTPVIKVPMGISAPRWSTSDEREIRALYPGKFVLASFGLATPEKRILSVLKALRELRGYYPNLLYLIVGEVAAHYELSQEIAQLGLGDCVQVLGRAEPEMFHRLMARADVVINLRFPSAGEMSATLLRALALGKPVLISGLSQWDEIPRNAAIRIRPDSEFEDTFHKLWQLIEDPDLRRRYGGAAQSYAATQHSPSQMLDGYHELIDLALEQKSRFKPPVLPPHLRDGRQIVLDYIRRSAFAGKESDLIDLIP
ncbi:MAG TPA: glycosyltransferase family 4 protein [Acidobacteriota bacterium]|nr:glycosyltransferase family 4 protein [Acidobacteriota bacterium]